MSMPHAQQLLEKAQAGEKKEYGRRVEIECYVCKSLYSKTVSSHNASIKLGFKEVCSKVCGRALRVTPVVDVECCFCRNSFKRNKADFEYNILLGQTRQYCSRHCSGKDKKALKAAQARDKHSTADLGYVEVICCVCKNSYTTKKRYHVEAIKLGRREVCSKECRFASRPTPPSVNVECAHCKKTFARNKYRSDFKNARGIAQYCSHECSAASTSTLKLYSCFNCKKEGFRSSYNSKKTKSGRQFCSQACYHEVFGPSNKGENHIGYTNGFGSYRKVAFLKSSSCVSCGESRPYILVAHHIDGNRKNNKSENLETVCNNCHSIRHLKLKHGVWVSTFKSLTPRQLIETFYVNASRATVA